MRTAESFLMNYFAFLIYGNSSVFNQKDRVLQLQNTVFLMC